MAKRTKKVNKGPHIRNANLIGKGGGQVKPVNGSFVKGIAASEVIKPVPSKEIKEHVKTKPARKPTKPDDQPSRERSPGRGLKAIAKSNVPNTVSKQVERKAPAKGVAKVKTAASQMAPKKATPVKTRKAPVRRR